MNKTHTSKLDKVYDLINSEKEKRICTDIDEKACQYVTKNYFLIFLSNMLTSLGDTLSNPKTVLAWLMNYVHAPVSLISLIVPIRESGSMLPQIFIAGFLRQKAIRKWIWVVGSFFQFVSILAIGLVALNFEGTKAGWYIILFLVMFSLSRSLCSMASKDVLGKTIPKTRRGRLKGFTVSISGILVLLAGLFMIYKSRAEQDVQFYATILFFAGFLWLLAAIVYANIKEFPGETANTKNDFKDSIAKLSLIKTDKPFRDFVISRALLLCSGLTAPFYVVLAQTYIGKESYLLGLFIIAGGIASIISAPFWGVLADKSSKNVMVKSVLIAAFLGIIMFVVISWLPNVRQQIWLYPLAFFILNVAHNGVRLGRKTYIVDMAAGNKRTDYVAVSNTIIGIILLITGGISALVSLISVEGIILVLSLIGIVGAFMSSKLPSVE